MLLKPSIRSSFIRFIQHASKVESVSETYGKAELSKLRKKTGYTLINCKKALIKFNNDLNKAEKWMRDEAKKEGWEKASKLATRPMSSGQISVLFNQNSNAAAMVEMNCETDFVSRNAHFQKLISSITSEVMKSGINNNWSNVTLNTTEINNISISHGSIADSVALTVGTIGENIAVRRASFVQAASPNYHIGSYVHSSTDSVVRIENCRLGRFGALVLLKSDGRQLDDVAELANGLSQHIVGLNPKTIKPPDTEIPTVESSEMSKLQSDKDQNTAVDSTCLLQQDYILDESMSVSELLESNSCDIIHFVRYECGEELLESE